MAPIEFLPSPRGRGPKPNAVAKFALVVATGGLMLGSGGHQHVDLAFQVYLFANLITFIAGLVLMYVSMVAHPHSTTTGNGKIAMWVTLLMSVVALVLGSRVLIFAN